MKFYMKSFVKIQQYKKQNLLDHGKNTWMTVSYYGNAHEAT